MFKKALAVIGSTFVVLVVSATAQADDWDSRRAGTDGHVTAWTLDRDVIDVDACPRMGSTWAYASCGSRFRAKINSQLCSKNGKGRHMWLYQVGDSKIRSTQTARCN